MNAAVWIPVGCTILGTLITLGTVVYLHGKNAGLFHGHEELDKERFSKIDKNVETIQEDIKQLLQRF